MIGAGMIAQIEHLPNLLRLRDEFEVIGVSDPSPASRDFVTGTLGIQAFDHPDRLYGRDLDAVVVASPDPLHHEQVLAAFSADFMSFCEKPLCYSTADIDDIIAARDVRAEEIVQVGYMKRFDPAYEAALEMIRLRCRATSLCFRRSQRSGCMALRSPSSSFGARPMFDEAIDRRDQAQAEVSKSSAPSPA